MIQWWPSDSRCYSSVRGGTMTPHEALQILDQAAAQAHLSRQDHAAVLEAVRVLRDALTPQPQPEPGE